MVEVTFRYRKGKELSKEVLSATFPRSFTLDQITMNYGKNIVVQSYKVTGFALIDAKVQKVTLLGWDDNQAYYVTEDGQEGVLPTWQVFENEKQAGNYLLSQRF